MDSCVKTANPMKQTDLKLFFLFRKWALACAKNAHPKKQTDLRLFLYLGSRH